LTTLALLLALVVVPPGPHTELTIRAVDEAGRPVTLTRADVSRRLGRRRSRPRANAWRWPYRGDARARTWPAIAMV